MATRTFLDAGVLISAFRGTGALAIAARDALDDAGREFVASDILRLELVPKPHYNAQTVESQFYEAYFAAVVEIVETTPKLVQMAETEAKRSGLSAADALHVVAARQARAIEFLTSERDTKPLFRSAGIKIVSLYGP